MELTDDDLVVFRPRTTQTTLAPSTIGLLAETLNTIAGPLVNHLNKMRIEPAVAAPRVSRIYEREVVRTCLAAPTDFGTRL